ncbi:GIY-YIG nuclease family protein [Brevundimonas sp.]|uniref:GIY-YIG nuclease family protein n=1 Tax=Brevundimonas sp. TaxID=1871086 RepID=UPI002D6A9DCB|nr:GIY-YIG nuclease family protein [Brevundimonas sp.]HYC75750.1 GIY-YIG nuclease family protein [Brevundimonas sp.]
MDDKRPLIATYIEASRPFGVIYTGMTSNLYRRSAEHRAGEGSAFTKRHGCNILVWYQPFERVTSAIHREKALKSWRRPWKMQLIEQRNPEWRDLCPFLRGEQDDPRLPIEDDCGVAAFLARLEDEAGEGE